MMKIMRRNELQSTEQFLMKKTNFYIIPPGRGTNHRSTKQSQRRSKLNLITQTDNEHRPTFPTTHRSTLESTVCEKETTRLRVGQMITITKAMQRDEADQHQAEVTGERTRFSHSIDRAIRPSIDKRPPSLIDIRPKPKPTVSENPNFDNQYLTPDEFGIFRDPDGYARAIDGMHYKYPKRTLQTFFRWLMEQIISSCNNAPFQHISRGLQKSSIDRHLEFGRRAFDLYGTRKFYWEEKDEYGVYRDDQGCARDVDGHIINVSKGDIRKLMERASRDEHSYICLPEHANSFTQTTLVLKIYTRDEINEMFYGVYGAQEKNETDFQMKLDGV
ncbi:hypothetical protein F2Q69_00006941 [Brassica cretica]|uniref:Uncharacterized protein n=1 Tax=Brassica cretica TaxID=69181 RepID=A0A8S9P1I9_BRACR|nr:hypothetical protein F2Q69_00006941 [Brassica cretica]